MNLTDAIIRAETLWAGEQPVVEAHREGGWLVVTPNSLHLTHLLDDAGNPVCHEACKNLAEREAMAIRVEIYDALAALDHYHDHVDILLALRKVVHDDAERLGRNFRVPGVRIIEQTAEAAQ